MFKNVSYRKFDEAIDTENENIRSRTVRHKKYNDAYRATFSARLTQ